MKEEKRILWLDVARSLAILSVVWAHATTTICSLSPDFMNGISLQAKTFGFISLVLGRVGVPLFFMISGYLLLDRDYDGPKVVRFWKNKCLHLFLVTEIWTVLYYLFFWLQGEGWPSLTEFLKVFFFLQEFDGMGHMWYLSRLLGCYLFLPLIAIVLKVVGWQRLRFLLAIAVLYNFGTATLNLFLDAMEKSSVDILLTMSFSGGVYGLYILLGYMTRKGLFRPIPTALLGVVALVSGGVLVWTMFFLYDLDIKYNMWYNNLFVLLMGVAIFELLARHTTVPARLQGVTQSLSRCSFSIFLFHYPVKILLTDWASSLPEIPFQTFTLFVTSLAISWAISALLLRGPKPVRWLLLAK